MVCLYMRHIQWGQTWLYGNLLAVCELYFDDQGGQLFSVFYVIHKHTSVKHVHIFNATISFINRTYLHFNRHAILEDNLFLLRWGILCNKCAFLVIMNELMHDQKISCLLIYCLTYKWQVLFQYIYTQKSILQETRNIFWTLSMGMGTAGFRPLSCIPAGRDCALTMVWTIMRRVKFIVILIYNFFLLFPYHSTLIIQATDQCKLFSTVWRADPPSPPCSSGGSSVS